MESINWPAAAAPDTMRPPRCCGACWSNYMILDQAPLNLRAAHWLADAIAMAVGLVRPLSTYTEEVEVAPEVWVEVTRRNVLVAAVASMPLWHLDAWRDHDKDPEGCLHVHALGCHIEVFYLRRPTVQAAG
jgi:hypothetical protein